MSALQNLSEKVFETLTQYDPETTAEASHYMAPHVPKIVWTKLGDLVSTLEKNTTGNVPGEYWLSIRLDGSNFGRTLKILRARGILEEGYSARFAESMMYCLRMLICHFNAVIGYTQSDEMLVILAPANICRDEQQPHQRNGRVTKISTLASGYVTACFITKLAELCEDSGISAKGLADALPHFDCRIGAYATWKEAQSILLWRAHDCSINGVSDAVHRVKGAGKVIKSKGTQEKVQWLHEAGMLPLPTHQAYGTVYTKVKRAVDGINLKTGECTVVLRNVIEQVKGPVLELARKHELFPEPDVLEVSSEKNKK
jgi:tRNA(His) 5'-end guanylyltransferase